MAGQRVHENSLQLPLNFLPQEKKKKEEEEEEVCLILPSGGL